MKRLILLQTLLLTVVAHAILDTNNNGLSDLWEKQYNDGQLFSPTNPEHLPNADPDLDGWDNRTEAAAGTDPSLANPPEGIVANTLLPSATAGAYTLTWPTRIGKRYQLQASSDLESWLPVGEPIIAENTSHSIGINVTQPGSPTPPKLFWHITINDIDSDSDGLTNNEEHQLATDSSTSDSDGDTISDYNEVLAGTDPNNQDTDADGAADAIEFTRGSDPKSADSVPPCDPDIVAVARLGHAKENDFANGDFTTSYLYRKSPGSESITFDSSSMNLNTLHTGVQAQLYPSLDAPLLRLPIADFRGLPTTEWEDGTKHYGPDLNVYSFSAHLSRPYGITENPSKEAVIYSQNLQIKNQWRAPEDTVYRFLKIHLKAPMPAPPFGQGETLFTFQWNIPASSYAVVSEDTEVVELKIDKGEKDSSTYGLEAPAAEPGMYHLVGLLPIEAAPDVLAVNSDFDEGRIDPAAGYAIPDCDDMPNVDLKTGSGNTKVELDAERNHLDGRFSQGDDVVDDLHKGWFGVNPKACSDEFWNGANITIRKIDKIDDDTGYKESGQVRFYAKWGGNYYGIAPYDFQTLQPVNLVSAGVNLRPNEGVYGPSSTIPDGAEFYMEGVRPGKITLEWRLQKGSIDVKHEQTFKVETRKSPGEWKADLAYKIRLDTNNDPSGQINVTVDPRGAPKDSWSTVDRMSEYYDYYRENYLLDDDFQWCGMARLAGSQVLAGVNDASNAVSGPSNPLYVVIGELIDSLRNGGFDIFDSIAWQHHAYRSSGLEALKWTKNNTNNTHLNALLSAWVDYDKGKKDSDVGLIAQAARAITRHEQNQVIVNTWTELRQIRLENGNAADVFTILSENVMKPNGDRFTVAVPGGDLGNTADRWKWIDDGPSGSTNGIIAAWKAAGKAGQRPLVANTIREDGKRFSLTYQVSGLPLFFVRDHLDIP